MTDDQPRDAATAGLTDTPEFHDTDATQQADAITERVAAAVGEMSVQRSDDPAPATSVEPAETDTNDADCAEAPSAPARTAEDDAFSEALVRELMATEATRAEEDAQRAEEARQIEEARLKAEREAEEAARLEAARIEAEREAEAALHAAEDEVADADPDIETLDEATDAPERAARAALGAAFADLSEDPDLADDIEASQNALEAEALSPAAEAAPEPESRSGFVQPAPQQPRIWDTPTDHEMTKTGRRTWQFGVYGALIAVPVAFFALSPFGPRDTVGHHISAMGCQFADLFEMKNAEVGQPGYHASLDDDADGIACEEKKETRITMGGGSRFVRP